MASMFSAWTLLLVHRKYTMNHPDDKMFFGDKLCSITPESAKNTPHFAKVRKKSLFPVRHIEINNYKQYRIFLEQQADNTLDLFRIKTIFT